VRWAGEERVKERDPFIPVENIAGGSIGGLPQ